MKKLTAFIYSLFLIMYLAAGAYYTYGFIKIIGPGDLLDLVYLYYIFVYVGPLVLAVLATAIFIFRKKANIFIWLCIVYWLMLFLNEITEGVNWSRNIFMSSFVMAIVSILCFLFLWLTGGLKKDEKKAEVPMDQMIDTPESDF